MCEPEYCSNGPLLNFVNYVTFHNQNLDKSRLLKLIKIVILFCYMANIALINILINFIYLEVSYPMSWNSQF